MLAWGEFFKALVLKTSRKNFTVPLVVARFALVDFSYDRGVIAAAGMLAIIPPIVLVLLFQRFIILGLVSGGVKV